MSNKSNNHFINKLTRWAFWSGALVVPGSWYLVNVLTQKINLSIYMYLAILEREY